MMRPDKGMIAAVLALLVLGGIIAWRMNAAAPADTAEEDIAADSAPLTLEQLEAEAQADPDNPQGWQRLGLAQFQSNEFEKAASAYERATQADDESAVLWSSLGEARVMASPDDPMPPAAVEAFERTLALDPGDPRARYFMAVRRDLSGDHEGAIGDWLALLADTPPGAPWETDLVRTIQQVGAINEIAVDARIASASGARDILPGDAMAAERQAARGPTTEQMAAAAALPASEQQNMAEGMVARLAQRLQNEPGDVDGWVMLMRSYRQLGRDGAARDARDSAIAANPDKRDEIESAAEMLGVN